MTHTIEEFLARVEQHTGKPARPTWDGWQANCPATTIATRASRFAGAKRDTFC